MSRVPSLAVLLALTPASAAPSIEDGWTTLPVPGAWEAAPGGAFAEYDGFAWYRCFVDVPDSWRARDLALRVDRIDDVHEAFVNGVRIGLAGAMPPAYRNDSGGAARYTVPPGAVRPGRANLIALRVYDHEGQGGFNRAAPVFIGGHQAIRLAGRWQFRTGDDAAWARWPVDASAPRVARFDTVVEAATALGRDGQQTGPLSPAESLSRFQVPDDLEIEQIATEPAVRQPVSISFDERGRMWVVQYVQYPHPAGLRMLSRDKFWRAHYDKVPPAPPYHFPGKDQITIHEDTDGDGTFDKRSTFLKGLNIVTSVAHGRGGVWVLNPPYLLFYPDNDGDDVPDRDPDVHLAGFGLEDTHSVVNSLRWGPDGWLYAAQGSTVSADVVRPGLDTEVMHSMGQLVWRYHPETRRYEVFAEGGGNTFGVEIDGKGRTFSGHNGGDTRGFHYPQGGYSRKGFEKHGALSNPYAFGYFRAMAHEKVQRFTHTFIFYEADALPEHYHGKLFGPNPVRRHVVYSEVTPIGSTFRTRDLGHPITTSDQWFRPVDIKIGPDGAIYVADWYDGQVNHYRNHEGQIDPASGRIYRLKAKGARPVPPVDLRRKSTPELIDLLAHGNRWFRQTALRLIGDRRDASVVGHLTKLMREQTGQLALEALWALNLSGGFNERTAGLALRHRDPHVRRWAVRLLGDERRVSRDVAATLVDLAATDPNVEVRSQLASTARRLPAADTVAIVRELLTRDRDTEDLHVPLLIWWAIEAKAESDRAAVIALFRDVTLWPRPLVADHLLERMMRRYAMAGRQADLLTCAELFDLAPDRAGAQRLMAGFEKAFQGRPIPRLPDKLVEAMARHGLGSSVVLGLRQGRPEAVDEALRVIADREADAAQRRLYIQTFGEIAQPRCVPILLRLIDQSPEESLLAAALVALQTYDDARIAAEILDRYHELPESLHGLAQEMLTARPAWAVQLLHAIEADEIAPDRIKPEVLEKLRVFSEAAIVQRVGTLFGAPPSRSTEQMQQQMERFARELRAEAGSPYAGRKLFSATCGSCHALFGQGGRVGPDLTSYRRDDLEFMLLHIVHPNAEIREGYENVRITTTDGLILTGVIAEEDNRTLALRGANDQVLRLPLDQIDTRQTLSTSLMPQGLLDAFTEQQTRDLFAYLRGTQPLNE